MAPACWLCGCVRGGFRKETMASVCLDARHCRFSQYVTGAFQAAILVMELRGSESEQVSPSVGSLRTAWGSSSFFHQLNPHWFLQPEVVGTYLLALGPWAGGLVWAWDSLLLRHPSRVFIHHTRVWDQPIPCLHPSYQSGWMWFL